jgi:hypothetical protein
MVKRGAQHNFRSVFDASPSELQQWTAYGLAEEADEINANDIQKMCTIFILNFYNILNVTSIYFSNRRQQIKSVFVYNVQLDG